MNGARFLKCVFWFLVAMLLVLLRPLFLPIWFFSKADESRLEWFAWYPQVIEKVGTPFHLRILWLKTVQRLHWISGSSSETCDGGVKYIINGETWV